MDGVMTIIIKTDEILSHRQATAHLWLDVMENKAGGRRAVIPANGAASGLKLARRFV
jgi:hypothetical protein